GNEKPMHIRLVQARAALIQHRFDGQRKPEIRRITAQGVAKPSRRSHPDDRHGMVIDDKRAAYDLRIEAIMLLPGAVADDDHRRGVRLVVFRIQAAPDNDAYPEHLEIISGDEFAVVRVRSIHPTAADAQIDYSRAEGSQFREFGGVVTQLSV